MSSYKRFGLTNLRDAGRGKSGPSAYYQTMEIALRELLIEKNIFTADDVRRQIEFMDGRNTGIGARLVARAWVRCAVTKLARWRTAARRQKRWVSKSGRPN